MDDDHGRVVPPVTMRAMNARFMTLADVAELMNISASQVYALVRAGDLPAIKIGGRGQWRVETQILETWISAQYAATADFVRTHPLSAASSDHNDSADRW